MESKKFELWIVLSVISKKSVYDKEKHGTMGLIEFIDHLLPLLSFITGEPTWIHDASRVADEVSPYIYEQIPGLKDIRIDGSHQQLIDLQNQFGEEVELRPMHLEDHVSLPPEVSLRMAGFKGDVIYSDELFDEDES